MFDIGWTEIAIIAVVAIIVIGPKDLPRVLRTLGEYVGKAKAMTNEFRRHVDDMIRETELDEVKKQIDAVSNSDIKGYVENTIDPKGEIKQTLEDDFRDMNADWPGREEADDEALAKAEAAMDEEAASAVDDFEPITGPETEPDEQPKSEPEKSKAG